MSARVRALQCCLEALWHALWCSAHNNLYAPSPPEHLLHNCLCLLSASPQDGPDFYAWIGLIQSCNVNIFQALCPVLCVDVIRDLTRAQLAGTDSLKQSYIILNFFSLLGTSFTSYLFLYSGSSDLPLLTPLGGWGGFKLLLKFTRFPSCCWPKSQQIILPRWQVTGVCATSKTAVHAPV